MIVNEKTPATSSSAAERKLWIELPNPKQIYTIGSSVTGIVHLGTKDLQRTLEVKVCLRCAVRSFHHKYYGNTSHDVRRETTKLLHEDEILWSSSNEGNSVPPVDFPFNITIPNVGFDKKAKNPQAALPPSFHAGSRQGWRHFGTHGSPIGSVKYYIKVVVARKGTFTHTNKAVCPFIFLPPSPPPPLLPQRPEGDLGDPISLDESQWSCSTSTSNIRQLLSSSGQAQLYLWLPRIPAVPRMISIPFLFCLTIRTQPSKGPAEAIPSQDHLPPAAQIDKTTLYLQRKTHVCAKNGKDTHLFTFSKGLSDNLLYGLVPEEREWTKKTAFGSGTEQSWWEKRYLWRGIWTCREPPSFTNRQLTWQYALLGEVPIKGLGNGVKVIAGPLEINSGVTEGENVPVTSEESGLDLPPDYFDLDGIANEEDDDGGDEKSPDHDQKRL